MKSTGRAESQSSVRGRVRGSKRLKTSRACCSPSIWSLRSRPRGDRRIDPASRPGRPAAGGQGVPAVGTGSPARRTGFRGEGPFEGVPRGGRASKGSPARRTRFGGPGRESRAASPALDYCALLAVERSDRFEPAACWWLSVLLSECGSLTLDDVQLAAACLGSLPGGDADAIRETLRLLVKGKHRLRGQ